MKLLFKQRLFSWFDSYDIYDEDGNTMFTVKGKLSWGHKLEIYNNYGVHVGTVEERIFTLLPKFEMHINGSYIGEIKKELTLFKPVFTLDCNGWIVKGDWLEWEYEVMSPDYQTIMQASKKLWNLTDTYSIEVPNPDHVLISLMIVLAIDAAKCSNGK